jgi:protein MpaA
MARQVSIISTFFLITLISQLAIADEVTAACQKISKKLASVSHQECNKLKLKGSGDHSVKGFPILIKEYPPLKSRSPRGRVLLIGGTHGDELTSISVVFKWMNTLEKHHSGLFHWRISPLLNPDGALQPVHSRTNANQVDLNRNFVTPNLAPGAAITYWEGKGYKNNRRYPGPYPLSEPESHWLFKEIRDFKPDVIIAVHAPYSLVDFDAPDRKNAPKKIGYLHKNLMGTFPGSLGNYAGMYLGTPVITLELPHAGIMPSKNNISKLWTDLVRWLLNNL